MGTLSKIIFNQNTKATMPNNNNENFDLKKQIKMKLQKAEELANIKGRSNRELFTKGDILQTQDPKSMPGTKEDEVIEVQKYNRKPQSHLVKGSDGVEYLRNGCYLFLQASPETESVL